MRVKNVLVGEDADFRSRGNDVKIGFMTRKNGFNEVGRNGRSDTRDIGIAEAILRVVLGFIGAILGGVVMGVSLFSVAGLLRNDVIL